MGRGFLRAMARRLAAPPRDEPGEPDGAAEMMTIMRTLAERAGVALSPGFGPPRTPEQRRGWLQCVERELARRRAS